MNNQLIILETIQTLSQGISQQQNIFVTDNLVNPLLPNVDNTANPVVPNVENPEPVTLYHFASRKLRTAIANSLRTLMNQHNFPLPDNWTYEQLTTEIIGQPGDLGHLVDILRDLTTFGFASQPFHQLLDFLHTVAP